MRWAELNSTETRFALTWFSRCSSQLQYKTLEDKLRGVEEDLRQSTSKFSELQRTLESERQVWVSDKKTLEDTIVDLSTSEKTSETDRSARESEVRQQEQRALVKLTISIGHPYPYFVIAGRGRKILTRSPYSCGVDQDYRDPQATTHHLSSYRQGEFVRSC